ncbi:4-amino-4-deoxychorismate lyase [Sphingobacterium sp. DK4209]|uniref:branched-chain-amino-acid transaminase n=1 Tax=Sphingobacterium zhuxiongii TaxID=2662364 RepID=A0A5Q0QAT0_9SPHI|nr:MULTISPECIES: aminotransferase class IV [unclassified Sphingobacterium]MVZ65273.1 4-amino-4-deoxychorismate lyase [Sphingobacterium sp. DK4209]QGA26364.1 4-amino-4-deoxychorismate lyase [Sphingobacterium sp. dk4302]
MPIQYINFNGSLVPEDMAVLSADNRAFRYGDGLFETMLWKDGDIRFLDFHVERLQEGMSLLQFEDTGIFDTFFVRSKTEELIRKNNMMGQVLRVRLIIFRMGAGLYGPESNKAGYVLQVERKQETLRDKKLGLIVDLYTDFKKPYSELSKLKSNNALVYVMAGIFRKKHAFDEVFIVNQAGNLCEALTSNIFIYYNKVLYTPALSEGCIAGVMRRVVMDIALSEGIEVVEAEIKPDIMKVADEIFCTNATQGIQWVMGYKQKRYFNKISRVFQDRLANWTYEVEE